MEVNLKNDINESYYPFFKSKAPELISYGGTGAGKSYTAAQKVIINHLLKNTQKSLAIRKTGPSLRFTSWDLILNLLDLYKIPYKPQNQKFEIHLNGHGRILFAPIVNTRGEPAERLKSLKDIDLIWIEEPTEITEEEYDMVNLSVQGPEKEKGYRQTILTFNPIDQNHWIKKRFFDGNIGDRQKYTYKDNLKFLDQFSIDKIEALKTQNPYMYQVYGLGDWGVYEDVIYTNYVVEKIEHPLDYYEEVIAGLDFGYEHPQAFLFIGIREYDIYLFNEIYLTHTQNRDFGDLVKIASNDYKIPDVQIYCDSSRPDLISELELMGLNVYGTEKGQGSVVAGIREVLKYRIHIDENCINTIKEIQGYRRKKDRNGNTLEEPVKFKDDAMDVIRGAIYTHTHKLEPCISTFGRRKEEKANAGDTED